MRYIMIVGVAFTLFAISTTTSRGKDRLGSSSVAPPITTAGLERYARAGNGSVVGKAEITTTLFGVKAFGREKVRLIPLTDYNWWFENRVAFLLGAKSPETVPYPKQLAMYNRSTYTDDNGNYQFDGVPAGNYFVQFFVDYESDTSRIENNTIYSTNDDDLPMSTTTQRVKLKLRRELDDVAAPIRFMRDDEILRVTGYMILGTQTCCEGEL